MLRVQKSLTVLGLGLLAMSALSGCSAQKSYSSVSQLRSAYEDAGGSCSDPLPVPEALIGTGAHARDCCRFG
jgi:hypothetical protein